MVKIFRVAPPPFFDHGKDHPTHSAPMFLLSRLVLELVVAWGGGHGEIAPDDRSDVAGERILYSNNVVMGALNIYH
jgi:hypothetical protein